MMKPDTPKFAEMPEEIYVVTGCKDNAGMWAKSQISKERQKIMGELSCYVRSDLAKPYMAVNNAISELNRACEIFDRENKNVCAAVMRETIKSLESLPRADLAAAPKPDCVGVEERQKLFDRIAFARLPTANFMSGDLPIGISEDCMEAIQELMHMVGGK